MRVGDSRSFGGPGFLPLQHEGFEQEDWPLDFRCSLVALRILGREDNKGGTKSLSQQGHWIEDANARGDLIGGMYWQRASRPIGGWRFSWPAKTASDQSLDEGQEGPKSAQSTPSMGWDIRQAGSKITFGAGSPSTNKGFGVVPGSSNRSGTTMIAARREPKRDNKPGTKGPNPKAPEVTGSGSGHCKEMDTASLLPIWKKDWSGDNRFAYMSYQNPMEGEKNLWPKFPLDWFGIVLSADNENYQEELFYPTDPRMVAVHCHGDKEMGSLVGDMKSGFRVDPDKLARLQSIFKVGHEIEGDSISSENPVIAINVGKSGCDDTLGGLIWQKGKGNSTPQVRGPQKYTRVALPFMDNPSHSDSRNYETIPTELVAEFNRLLNSGQFGKSGHGTGKYQEWKAKAISDPNSTTSVASYGEETVAVQEESGDGCPKGRYGHLSQRYSGPFELDCGNDHVLGEDGEGNKIFATHLSLNSYFVKPGGLYDGPLKHDGLWGSASVAPFPVNVRFEFDPSMPHPFIGGGRYGMHRWRSYTWFYEPYTPPAKPPPGDPIKDIPITEEPGLIITDDGIEIPTAGDAVPVGDRNMGAHGSGGVDPALSREISEKGDNPQKLAEWPLKYKAGVYRSVLEPYTLDDGMRPFVATTIESGLSSILARPQKVAGNWTNYKNWTMPDLQEIRDNIDKQTPITGRLEAFGAQGQKVGSTYLTSDFGWNYTHGPESYRYMGGTADGGWCMLAPEIDLADVDNSYATASGASRSTTSFIAGPGSQFGVGTPDLQNGGVGAGYVIKDDSGDLRFGSSTDSTVTNRVVFESGGNVGIGVDNPSYLLQVKDPATSSVDADIMQLESAGNSTADSWGMTFCNALGEKAGFRAVQASSSTTSGELEFRTASFGTMVPYTVMDDTGKWAYRTAFMDEVFTVDPENWLVGATAATGVNMGWNTTDVAGGEGIMAIGNATTVPAGTPSGGGVLYVESGALKFKGSSGTVTTIANA